MSTPSKRAPAANAKPKKDPWYSTPAERRVNRPRNLSLTPEASAALDELAERFEESRSEVASRAVIAYAKEHAKPAKKV